MLNMIAQRLDVIDSLLPYKDSAALKAHKTEGLLMRGLHVAPQTLFIREVLLGLTIVNQASERTESHTLLHRLAVSVVDGFISAVLVTIMAHPFVELIPCQVTSSSNYNFAQFLLAESAILVVQDETNSQTAFRTDKRVAA